MNPTIINDDILIIDDFLNEDELRMLKYGIYTEKHELQLNTKHKTTRFNRLYLYDKYRTDDQSLILTMIRAKMFSLETVKQMKKLGSFPFQTYNLFNWLEVQLTAYGEGGNYHWHIDNNDGRQMSYILPVQMTKEQMWSGGNLHVIAKGKDITIIPKNNRLIVFSAHLSHKVDSVTLKDKEDILSGRVVINGHVGVHASKETRKRR